MPNDKTVLFSSADGPEGLEIYTSDSEGVSSWSTDLPSLFVTASVQGADFKIGPFHMSSIRLDLEKAFGKKGQH